MKQVAFYVVAAVVIAAVIWFRRLAHNKLVARAKAVAASAGLTIDIGRSRRRKPHST